MASIKKYTDYQIIHLSDLTQMLDLKGNEFKKDVGKKIKNIKGLEVFTEIGFGNLKIVEIKKYKDGFDAVVYKEQNGNYMVSFACSDWNEKEDTMFDVYPLLYQLGFPIIKKVAKKLNFSTARAAEIYYSQQRQASKLVNKYYNKAKKEKKKLIIQGYSLGGNLAEYAFINLKETKCLESLLLYNPYHLPSYNDAKKVRDYENLKLYCRQGDSVSSVFNQSLFIDKAKYIKYDWDKDVPAFRFRWSMIALAPLIGIPLSFSDSKFIGNLIDRFKLIYEGAHCIPNIYDYSSFNEDGSLKDAEATYCYDIFKIYFGVENPISKGMQIFCNLQYSNVGKIVNLIDQFDNR